MSLLPEDFGNSQHEFAEVIDEDTTSGGLDTFEISSSNSLPTCSSNAGGVVVAVDDSSSTDTIKIVDVDSASATNSHSNGFFNSDEVYVINDDDDDDDEDDENAQTNSNFTNATQRSAIASHMDSQANGVIMTSAGTAIYLETPVIEEQQHHSQLHEFAEPTDTNSGAACVAGKPKRLSDEFLLAENAELVELEDDVEVVNAVNEHHHHAPAAAAGLRFHYDATDVKTDDCAETSTTASTACCSKDRVANTLTNNRNNLQLSSMADIESMDLIERRDFENEQRLTNGILLKSSAFMNKNLLNLNLVKSCMQQPQMPVPSLCDALDEFPSSSNYGSSKRAVSSDSKCVYKDSNTTPTSSRNHNGRLTKSTAKINLCSTLYPQQNDVLPLEHHGADLPDLSFSNANDAAVDFNGSALNSSVSNSSSVIVDGKSVFTNASNTGPVITEVFSNCSINDVFIADNSSTSATQQAFPQPKRWHSVQQLSTADATETDSGCSRTHTFIFPEKRLLTNEDMRASTSSARCHYSPTPKTQRQVHASAQTNEPFLPRLGASAAAAVASTSNSAASSRCNTADIAGGSSAGSVRSRRRRNMYDAIKEVVEVAPVNLPVEEFSEEVWGECEEISSDVEELCTCQQSSTESSHGGSNMSLNESEDLDNSTVVVAAGANKDGDLSNYIQMVSISEEGVASGSTSSASAVITQRKRKYNDGRLLDGGYSNYSADVSLNGSTQVGSAYCRKRIAFDTTSTTTFNGMLSMPSTPTTQLSFTMSSSPLGRRTPRPLIPNRDNPPPELQNWLLQFQRWSHAERLLAVDRLIEHCDPTQVRHMMQVIEPQFQRDFISLLPRELALQVLSFLEPKDLLRAAQTCRSWRFLCDDNLLWKEKCRKAQILTESRNDRPKRGRAGVMPPISSVWKAAYMRQHIIESNWRSRPIREPKVLKGHDDHVITCLQFSGNRIVSGSDDNTLKVWSAVTGRCLRTLIGHTGGVWSSQMSGNIIISGSTDRTLKVWDMETGVCVHTLLGHTSTVRCMHLHGNKVVSGSRDATLRVWDIEQGTCLHVLVGHLAAVRCVQYDGKLIVSGAYDYMVKIWHPERQECLHTLQGHTNRVYSLQFDGVHVVSGSLDTSIRVWDVETGNCKHTLMGHQSLTSGMELRQNILVSGNADSTVKVWDITSGQCLQTLSGPNKHQSAVTCLQFNTRFVVTSSDDGTVKLWDVKTGEFIRNLVALESGGSGGVVWRIRASDTKLICAVGSRNGTEETKLMVLDFDVEGACVKCS